MSNLITPVYNGLAPSQGPKAIQIAYSLINAATRILEVNLYAENSSEAFSFAQAMFVDNSQSTEDMTIIFSGTQYRIVAKTKTQGWYSVIVPDPVKFTISVPAGNAGATGNLFLTNVPMPSQVWSVS